jgi:hypothetical protein
LKLSPNLHASLALPEQSGAFVALEEVALLGGVLPLGRITFVEEVARDLELWALVVLLSADQIAQSG